MSFSHLFSAGFHFQRTLFLVIFFFKHSRAALKNHIFRYFFLLKMKRVCVLKLPLIKEKQQNQHLKMEQFTDICFVNVVARIAWHL